MLTQAEIEANPIGSKLVFEDDHVRIWRIEIEPGEEVGYHTHYLDYTTVVVEGGVVERPNADGTVDRFDLHPGDIMRWHQGTQRHALRNIGSTRFTNVIVEVKGLTADFGDTATSR